MLIRKSNIPIFTIILTSFLFFSNCKNKNDIIPYVYVDYYVNLSDPDFSGLNAIGNYVYVTGGYRGMILYRRSIDEFVAYDRACTYEPSKECEKISVDETGLIAICECCGSKFNLYDGYVLEGVAVAPLKEYSVSYDGLMTLHIYNGY